MGTIGKENNHNMSMLKKGGAAVAAAMMCAALGGVSSASAANWDPANTTLTAHGSLTLTSAGQAITCTYHSGVRSAGGADAFTTEPGGTTPAAPTFPSCNTFLGLPVTVTSPAAWTLTATSTTNVHVSNASATIKVGTICTITAVNITLANNSWSNATATLTPSTTAFPVTWHANSFLCPVSGAQTATMSGSVTATGASIT